MAERFYLTTPIYYVNDVRHIGTAYTTLAADIIAPFQGQRGGQVLFGTGRDESAPKVAEAAAAGGQEPLPLVARRAERFQAAWAGRNVGYDVFTRATEPRHERAVQA